MATLTDELREAFEQLASEFGATAQEASNTGEAARFPVLFLSPTEAMRMDGPGLMDLSLDYTAFSLRVAACRFPDWPARLEQGARILVDVAVSGEPRGRYLVRRARRSADGVLLHCEISTLQEAANAAPDGSRVDPAIARLVAGQR
ncbi:hypothetical protein LHK_01649 [Laribacter hongkongensis HLHK9]|uniref:Uncharacterized protein n=1 Tax=Laribacter hongkongensis (strain HLHK9) TaxID=557598 RepID=C1D845_LARHH|nr:hypothetical protein [Laribacter hongkongensis]ACO74635.1 hypothetical protein LHK_01649 [Laribacter hongkongensis HLHK9]